MVGLCLRILAKTVLRNGYIGNYMGVFTAQQRPHQIECSKIDPNYESVFYAPENIEDTWQKSLEHCGDDQLARIDSLSKQRQVKGSRAYYFFTHYFIFSYLRKLPRIKRNRNYSSIDYSEIKVSQNLHDKDPLRVP